MIGHSTKSHVVAHTDHSKAFNVCRTVGVIRSVNFVVVWQSNEIDTQQHTVYSSYRFMLLNLL